MLDLCPKAGSGPRNYEGGKGIRDNVAHLKWIRLWFRVLAIVILVAVWPAGRSLWAENSVIGDSDSTAEQAETENPADEEEKKTKVDTVEFRVPDGGYLTLSLIHI